MDSIHLRLPRSLKQRAEHIAVDLRCPLQSLLREGLELRLALLDGEAALLRVARGLGKESK